MLAFTFRLCLDKEGGLWGRNWCRFCKPDDHAHLCSLCITQGFLTKGDERGRTKRVLCIVKLAPGTIYLYAKYCLFTKSSRAGLHPSRKKTVFSFTEICLMGYKKDLSRSSLCLSHIEYGLFSYLIASYFIFDQISIWIKIILLLC